MQDPVAVCLQSEQQWLQAYLPSSRVSINSYTSATDLNIRRELEGSGPQVYL
ncbi:hypothetical protein NQZ68_007791 [Dissostichus eleginoides]|nr:hypothetical protein NQZ68_007791 [Dissostichus eleginoides]